MNNSLSSKKTAKKNLSGFLYFEDKNRVASDMIDISVACLPLIAWGVYLFGSRVLMLTLVSAVSCLVFDILMSKLIKSGSPSDMSWLVVGLTSALCMPISAPLWLPVISSAVAIIFVKHIMTKLGAVRLHPTVCGILVLYLVFPSIMNNIPCAGEFTTDATALELLFSGMLPEQSIGSVFFGLRSGMIGEVSSFLIIAGGIFLLIRRVISIELPAACILVSAVMFYIFPKLAIASDTIALTYTFCHIISGNLLFSLFFLTSYPGSSPTIKNSKLILGALSGGILFLLRYFISPTSDTLIIILMINLLADLVDGFFKPNVFGGRVKQQKTTENKENK